MLKGQVKATLESHSSKGNLGIAQLELHDSESLDSRFRIADSVPLKKGPPLWSCLFSISLLTSFKGFLFLVLLFPSFPRIRSFHKGSARVDNLLFAGFSLPLFCCPCPPTEQCQMVVFVADDLGGGCLWGPGFRTSWQSCVHPKTLLSCLEKWSRKRRDAFPQSTCRAERNLGPQNPKSVTSRSVTWQRLILEPLKIPEISFWPHKAGQNHTQRLCFWLTRLWLYHPATDPPAFLVKPPSEAPISGSIFGRFARFRPFSANFGQKRPKLTRNRLLLKGLLWVLGGAGEEVCGWKSGHKTRVQ